MSNAPKNSSLEGHVLVSPLRISEYMILLCFKNGSLVRKALRDRYFSGSSNPEIESTSTTEKDLWLAFNNAVDSIPIGNNNNISLHVISEEITPKLRPGVARVTE